MGKNEQVLPYEKDFRLEEILERVNQALQPIEEELIEQFEQPQYPLIFIGGTQRSGTTLAIQLLRAYFNVGYISNLGARFWRAPYIGALLMEELRGKQRSRSVEFVSELGTTYGYEGSHEFGFFWQRWFPYGENSHQTTRADLEQIDATAFRRELAALESVFNAPLVFKNPIVFTVNIPAIAKLLSTAHFVICRREPIYVAQSTLLARIKYHGNADSWLSVKPQEYPQLCTLSVEEQIAGQIYYTEQRIKQSLAVIPEDRYLVIDYSDLSSRPDAEMERVRQWISEAGFELERTGFHAKSFETRNDRRLDEETFSRLEAALELFYNK